MPGFGGAKPGRAADPVVLRERTKARLEKINECLLTLGTDYEENVRLLTELAGRILGGTCALYNRIREGMLSALGQWQTPPDFQAEDKPDGHICYDVIRRGTDDVLLVSDLQNSHYLKTDPNVVKYSLKTYLGHVVRCTGEPVGSLCVVYQEEFEPDEEDRQFLSILAAFIGGEENRRRAEEILKQSEENYRSIFNSLDDAIFVHEIGSERVLDVNLRMCEMYGYSIEELKGLGADSLSSGAPPYSKKEAMQYLEKAVKGEPQTFEWMAKEKSGRLFRVEVKLKHAIIMGQERVLAIVRDITERKRAEEELKKRMEQMERMNEIMLGREMRIIEIKKEVNDLCSKLGLDPRYEVH